MWEKGNFRRHGKLQSAAGEKEDSHLNDWQTFCDGNHVRQSLFLFLPYGRSVDTINCFFEKEILSDFSTSALHSAVVAAPQQTVALY